jgi:hypothetical protein
LKVVSTGALATLVMSGVAWMAPMMGMPPWIQPRCNGLFSGSALAAVGSLVGPVVYGAVLGLGFQIANVGAGATSDLASAN